MAAKPVTKSRTNRAAALIATVVVAKVLSKYMPGDVAHQVADILSDEVVGGVVTVLTGAVVYFRQAANPPVDQQNVVTPRPK